MHTLRKAADRGRTRADWLDSAHSFSFGDYRDPDWPGFRNLRVLNEDRLTPGGGFGPHPHSDMEILTFVIEGTLAHRDSAGWTGLIEAGEVQGMTAGTGIVHSERNASRDTPVHFLQVWIEPSRKGLEPAYEQRRPKGADAGLVLAAAPQAKGDALPIQAEARVYAGRLAEGQRFSQSVSGGHAWVQLVSGALELDGTRLDPGDGAALSDVEGVEVEALESSQLLLFDLS